MERSRKPDAHRPQLVLDHLPDAGSLLHQDQGLGPQLVDPRPSGPQRGGREGRSGSPRPRESARSEPPGGDGQRRRCRARARGRRRGRRPSGCRAPRARRAARDAAAGTRRAASARRPRQGRSKRRSKLARQCAGAFGGDLGQHLLLELQEALGTAIEAQSGLGRLHPATGAIEQLRAEPFLERSDLERDGGLGDTEPFGRLREASPFDHGAERGKLSRIHKSMLSQIACNRLYNTTCVY